MKKKQILTIPADIPKKAHSLYKKNYTALTKKTGRLMLFAADQKMEHLNRDFYGTKIAPEVNDPEHLFKIASKGTIGGLATHLGLIARYATKYPDINYIAKLNGKSNLVPTKQEDPLSKLLWSVDDVIALADGACLHIRGVAYTIYLGSTYEAEMLTEAAQMIQHAHQHGLVTILWIYPRGKAISDERAADVIAGAAGIAASLGSDFVKINPPKGGSTALATAVQAAGNTKVICSGGAATTPKAFLQRLYDQIHKGTTSGNATGRNIFTKPFKEAIAMTKAISAITHNNKKVADALKHLL